MEPVPLKESANATVDTQDQTAIQVVVLLAFFLRFLAVTPLISGVTTTGQVGRSGWSYYQLNAVNSSFLSVGIQETFTTGYLWLFAMRGTAPDLHNYDYAEQDTNSKYHHIHAPFSDPQSDTWIIGVTANPFAANAPIYYSIAGTLHVLYTTPLTYISLVLSFLK